MRGLLNFHHKLAPFVEVFGADAVKLVSYSELRDRGIDLFQHFAAHFLNWPDAVPGGVPPQANASRDVATTEILRMMNVMSHRAAGAATDRVRQKFDRLPDRSFLAPVQAAIAAHTQNQRFNDNWPALQALHDTLVETYHGRLVAPKRRFSVRAQSQATAPCRRRLPDRAGGGGDPVGAARIGFRPPPENLAPGAALGRRTTL